MNMEALHRNQLMPVLRTLLQIGVVMALGTATLGAAENTTAAAKEFVREHEQNIQPLEIEIGKSWWTANVTGKDEDFAAKETVENKLNDALADPKKFERLKTIH